ncbi:hydroxypyruvate isomerase family protein [Ideonella sp.]|uniref:hydroxypyruvate isomerase family protein n=1 Tax=Ideonella sp. TaxID=1929293 RepID=UPI0035AF321D
MPRFAANVSLLYPEWPFADRIAAAAADGFRAVECQFPYAVPAGTLAARLLDEGVSMVLLNAPAGDWAGGERGLAALPGREAECRAGVERALAYAQALGCPRVHLLAGVVPAGMGRDRAEATYLAQLDWAAAQARAAGCELLIEPLNAQDVPGYLLATQAQAHALVQAVGAPNLRVQMDLYHVARTEGDVLAALTTWLPSGRVGHLQVAGVPGRHEPTGGPVDWPAVFARLDALAAAGAAPGWSGWVGAEYVPRAGAAPGGTSAGLGWLRPWRD